MKKMRSWVELVVLISLIYAVSIYIVHVVYRRPLVQQLVELTDSAKLGIMRDPAEFFPIRVRTRQYRHCVDHAPLWSKQVEMGHADEGGHYVRASGLPQWACTGLVNAVANKGYDTIVINDVPVAAGAGADLASLCGDGSEIKLIFWGEKCASENL
jgi:hypothetical protein